MTDVSIFDTELKRTSDYLEYLEKLRHHGKDLADAINTTAGLLELKLRAHVRANSGRYGGANAYNTARLAMKPVKHAGGSAQEIANSARAALIIYQRRIVTPYMEEPVKSPFDVEH
jgi:hypothetical protein